MDGAGPSTESWRRLEGRPSVLRAAVRRFELAVLLGLSVLAVGTVTVSHQVAHREAIRDANVTAARVAEDVASTYVDRAVRTGGDSVERRRLDRALRAQMLDHTIAHIRLWSSTGTVLWSDDRSEVGRTYRLAASVQDLFGTRDSVTEPEHDDDAEVGGERRYDGLVEVYVGASDVDGSAFVFESYTAPDALEDNTAIIFWEFVWVGLGSLLLFAGTTVPMAVSAARRVDRVQRQHAELLRQALRSSRHERRRLAQEVHDGVIQDLAAAGYALPTILEQLPSGPEGAEARRLGRQVSQLLVGGVTELRGLAADLLPPDLEGADLRDALQELVVRCRSAGLEVVLDVGDDLDADPDVLSMVHRCVREALQNVVKHAQAGQARVTVARDGEVVTVHVADDGRGPQPARRDQRDHLGLRLLADMLHELGGDLALAAGPGGGAVLTATLPVGLAG
jgi:signal transduction histidine kinase